MLATTVIRGARQRDGNLGQLSPPRGCISAEWNGADGEQFDQLAAAGWPAGHHASTAGGGPR